VYKNIGGKKLATKSGKLKIISLGGLYEIGKNITAFEYGNEIIIVDCGLSFPQEAMLGIDVVIPDFTYLKKNKNKFKAIVLTHGHEDHIGAVPYLLKELNVPVYGTKFTLGLIENKLKDHSLKADLVCVSDGEVVNFHNFKIEYIPVTHSISDSCALSISTPAGIVFHSGDFKIDHTPVDNRHIDLQRIAEIGKAGVLLFLCESTNILQEGFTLSEKSVGVSLQRVFEESKKQRIIIATFSSNIHRIVQIVECAIKQNRKIAVIGRSMVNSVRISGELGYLNIPKNTLIEISEIKNFTDEQIVIITTGSQGESMAALSRMSTSEHRQIEVTPNDKIILSASPIPGNERAVSKVIDELMKKGVEVVHDKTTHVHVSGHGRKEEIKMLHALIKPKFFMPIHGEYKHLKAHKDLAIELGMDKENIFLMNIGETLELTKEAAKVTVTVPTGNILVDGLGVGDVGNIVLRDRKHLSEDGLMIVVMSMQKETGLIVAGPDIISRGFVYVRESEVLMREIREVVKASLEKCEEKNITEWSYIKNLVRDTLRDFLWQKTKRSPMILPIIMEV
jgi:ribonuclease J